jgi:hypothetical protein
LYIGKVADQARIDAPLSTRSYHGWQATDLPDTTPLFPAVLPYSNLLPLPDNASGKGSKLE